MLRWNMLLSHRMSWNKWFVAQTPVVRAAIVYIAVTLVYAVCAPSELWTTHTRYNHFVWLADAFLHGRLHLLAAPPAYAGGNDFAQFEGHWFVVFPPFPALLLVPVLAIAGGIERVTDGALFLLLAGVGPAALAWALFELKRRHFVQLSEQVLLGLSLVFAWGSVYFFTAVQGTVWFAAHVVTTSALCVYLAASIGAEHPWCAGAALSAVIATRTHVGFAVVFFIMEAVRTARHTRKKADAGIDGKLLLKKLWPVLALAGFTYTTLLWYNWARFHDPLEVGYQYLQIAWKGRIAHWGMFNYHYLARNLGIALTSLPYVNASPASSGVPFQINGHGLALWVTTPLYLWLLWPQRHTPIHPACYATLAVTAIPSLLYQNSGWVQFGQRFSNDYSPVLFLLLALGLTHVGRLFRAAAAFSAAVNLFGALTFARAAGNAYYYIEPTQRIIYQPD